MEITNFAGIILLVSFFDVDPSSKAVGFGTKLSLLVVDSRVRVRSEHQYLTEKIQDDNTYNIYQSSIILVYINIFVVFFK